jgi:hypothetical protein
MFLFTLGAALALGGALVPGVLASIALSMRRTSACVAMLWCHSANGLAVSPVKFPLASTPAWPGVIHR